MVDESVGSGCCCKAEMQCRQAFRSGAVAVQIIIFDILRCSAMADTVLLCTIQIRVLI